MLETASTSSYWDLASLPDEPFVGVLRAEIWVWWYCTTPTMPAFAGDDMSADNHASILQMLIRRRKPSLQSFNICGKGWRHCPISRSGIHLPYTILS